MGPRAGLEGAEMQNVRAGRIIQGAAAAVAAVCHSGLQVRAYTMLLLLIVGSYERRNWDWARTT